MYLAWASKSLLLITGLSISHVIYLFLRNRFKTTRLCGPRRDSLFLGDTKRIVDTDTGAAHFLQWERKFGSVYRIHGPLNTERIVLMDPKAITHFCSLDSWRFNLTPTGVKMLSMILGPKSILALAGEEHQRTRRVLNLAFTPVALKTYLPIFTDTAHRVRVAWDNILQANTGEETIINVAEWIENYALEVISLAAFSHDLGVLRGEDSAIADSLTALGNFKPATLAKLVFLIAQGFPAILRLPTPRNNLISQFSNSMDAITENVLSKARDEPAQLEGRSALAVLLRSHNSILSSDEIKVQMKALLFAGNETTSATLKWTLIELSRSPHTQEKLRNEISKLSGDPSYEDLNNKLPYLDAVLREILRLHPAATITREVLADDVIPLSRPIKTKNGTITDKLAVGKGTTLLVPVYALNRSPDLWGETASQFRPERWLSESGLSERVKELPGFRHLLTFWEGPHNCLGRPFAIIGLKSVLCVLVRNFKFRPRDGPNTEYDIGRRIIAHPIVKGEQGTGLPFRISKVE